MALNYSYKLKSLIAVLGLAQLALAGPTLSVRHTDASPNVNVCTGAVGVGCILVPVSSDSCINFTGGLSFLNKEVSVAVIPDGLACTFFSQFGCLSAPGGFDEVVLTGGTWSFFDVPGANSDVNFNDLSSSFICTPV
ncbi:hypothetical protein D9613_012377 [Agrocybe pediades]|uniref:Uncharacterized protein n=1 Tax=Agrocybe pediades TaxID=84607 RepID=A0A8H4VN88_9AGAR|nr:hypothetical protein D9613_012377 [Agrocybe pediades]